MVTADTSDREQTLATPLPCWHESVHAARNDVIVALSDRRARIATARPVPVGTPVFLELGQDAGIDAVAVATAADAFVVEFITVDDNAANLLFEARQPGAGATADAPIAEGVVGTAPITEAAPVPVPRVRTDELMLPPAAPLAAPPAVARAATTPAETTGEFLTAHLHARAGGLEPVIRTGEFLAIPASDPVAAAPAPPAEAAAAAVAAPVDTPTTTATFEPPAAPAAVPAAVPVVTGPSWARALDADLGDEPEGSAVEHTQRWPTARAASSEPDQPAATAPGQTEQVEQTERWPVARVAVTAPPEPVAVASIASATAPISPPVAASMPSTPVPTPTQRTPTPSPADETTRWPVARAVVIETPPVAAPPVAAPAPATPAVAAPPMAVEEGEDVVLEFTAPPRPIVARPLPPPEPAGVVEVDFTEFQDVLGVATFRADGAARPLTATRVTTPAPISISLPRTPSASLQGPAPEPRNPFGGDSGVGPRPDSTPPGVMTPADHDAPPEQWVVSAPSLPAPRLLDRGLDRVLRSGGPNSVTPRPLPFHDSTPRASLPVEAPAAAAVSAPPAPPTTPTAPPTAAVSADAATTSTPAGALSPRVVPAARSPFAVPPVSPVVAPVRPAVVPVVVPPRPPVPVSLPPRPAVATLAPFSPAAAATSPPAPVATTTPAPVATHPPAPGPDVIVGVAAAPTPPQSYEGSARVLPVTPSAEGLPVIVGDGDGT